MPDKAQPSRLSDQQQADFLREFMACEHRIRVYIRALVADREAADDLLQETAVTLLEKFDPQRTGTDFVNWACRVAWYKVLEWRQKRARDRLRFSEEAMLVIANCVEEAMSVTEERRTAMRKCFRRESPQNLQLLVQRYRDEVPVEEMAEKSGRSVPAVHKALSRTRISLHSCISRELRLGGNES